MAKYKVGDVVILNGDGADCGDILEAIQYVEGGGTGYPHHFPKGERVEVLSQEIGELGQECLVVNESGLEQSVIESQIEGKR